MKHREDPVYRAMIDALGESEDGRMQRMTILEMEEKDRMKKEMRKG